MNIYSGDIHSVTLIYSLIMFFGGFLLCRSSIVEIESFYMLD